MKSTIKRVVCVVAAATVGAAALATVNAQTTAQSSAPMTSSAPGAGHRGHFHHGGGGRFVGTLLRATKQLNLTEQQQASIKSILASARPARGAGRELQGPAMTVLGNPGDPGYAAAVQSEQASANTRIQKETAIASEIYAVLSTAQRNELPTVLASMQAKEQAHRAQWAAKRAAAGNS